MVKGQYRADGQLRARDRAVGPGLEEPASRAILRHCPTHVPGGRLPMAGSDLHSHKTAGWAGSCEANWPGGQTE